MDQPIYINYKTQSTNANIYSIKPDGSGLKKISTGDDEILRDVSSDGKKILYYVISNERGVELFVMNSDGTNKRLVKKLKSNGADACFSPDGNFVTFASDMDVEDPANSWNYYDYYIMKLDGTELQRISDEKSTCWFGDWK